MSGIERIIINNGIYFTLQIDDGDIKIKKNGKKPVPIK